MSNFGRVYSDLKQLVAFLGAPDKGVLRYELRSVNFVFGRDWSGTGLGVKSCLCECVYFLFVVSGFDNSWICVWYVSKFYSNICLILTIFLIFLLRFECLLSYNFVFCILVS